MKIYSTVIQNNIPQDDLKLIILTLFIGIHELIGNIGLVPLPDNINEIDDDSIPDEFIGPILALDRYKHVYVNHKGKFMRQAVVDGMELYLGYL